MEANRIGALSQAVEQGGSHHRSIHSNTTFDSTNSFDEHLQFDDSEFDMFNLPVLPLLQLSPPPVAFDEIDEAAAMTVMDPLSPPQEARLNTWKAKRIFANRKSATKSKERKLIYANELQERVLRLKAQAIKITEQLAIAERNTATMVARNNWLRMQLADKQQQLQHTLAHNEALKEEIRYYIEKNSQFDADMADDPCYPELLSKFSSQLGLKEDEPAVEE